MDKNKELRKFIRSLRTGEWIQEFDVYNGTEFICSVCGGFKPRKGGFYCPYCGANMDKNTDMDMELFFNILFDDETRERFLNDCREAGIVKEDGNDEKTKTRSSY